MVAHATYVEGAEKKEYMDLLPEAPARLQH